MNGIMYVFIFLSALCFSVMAHGHINVNDKDHMKEHLQNTEVDFDSLSDDELRFHYFKIHDVEGNKKLDGCELLQSLLHFHADTAKEYGMPPKIFSDLELSIMIDPVLKSDDKNKDGFIDYAEYMDGQISKGF